MFSPISPFKISYNTQKDNWLMNEFLTMCVQEEKNLSMRFWKDSVWQLMIKVVHPKALKNMICPSIKVQQAMKVNDNRPKCFFCKKKGHMKKNYLKYLKWLSNKVNLILCVWYESNFRHVPNTSWDWLWFFNSFCQYCATITVLVFIILDPHNNVWFYSIFW